MKKLPLPEIELLRHLFDYDAEAGVLRWRNSAYRGINGRAVGSPDRCGYLQVNYKGRMLMVHRICFAIHYGIDPIDVEIDHINGNRSDNRIENLRIATRRQNTLSRHTIHGNNKSGINGVSFDRESGKWKAYMCGKTIGRYASASDAEAAILEYKKSNAGDFCGSL